IGAVVESLAVLRSADVDQAIRFDDTGRRLEQERVRDCEDRRVGADADGERQRGGQREQGVAAQQARGVAEVLKPGVEHGQYYAAPGGRFTVSEPVPCTMPGTMPGTVPGTVPGTMPDTLPDTVPGTMPARSALAKHVRRIDPRRTARGQPAGGRTNDG